MNRQQTSYLKGRIQDLARTFAWQARAECNTPDSPALRKARRMVDRANKKKWAAMERNQQHIHGIAKALREALLFQLPQVALDAVKLFEEADVKDLLRDPEAAANLLEAAARNLPYIPPRRER